MHDALDASLVARVPTSSAFRARFGNPYAVIHRVDVHGALLEGVRGSDRVHFHTDTRIVRVTSDDDGVTAEDQHGRRWRGQALIGADGVRSVVRAQFVGDPHRVTGHVVYRAVVDKTEFPDALKWNAARLWAGPRCHLVHYPLRGGEQYNVVVTYHSREVEEWGVREGSREGVQSYFQDIHPLPRQLIDLPKSWKRWATADKDPIENWLFGRVTVLGDAAHPTTQSMAQGAAVVSVHRRRGATAPQARHLRGPRRPVPPRPRLGR